MGRLADGAARSKHVEQQMNAVAARSREAVSRTATPGIARRVVPAARAADARRAADRHACWASPRSRSSCSPAPTSPACWSCAPPDGKPNSSVRTALGASASRLSRQLLIEHLAARRRSPRRLAIGVAAGLLRLLALDAAGARCEQLERAHARMRAALAVPGRADDVTAVTLGWVVSRRATKAAAIATGLRTQSATRDVVRLRQVLVSVEVGAAVVLLARRRPAAAERRAAAARRSGFPHRERVTFQVGLPMSRYMEPAGSRAFHRGVVEKLDRSCPASSAAASARLRR